MRSRHVVTVETVSVIAFAALLAPLAWRLAAAPRTSGAWLALIAGAVAGYLAADVASGVVHWFCDRFFEEDTPGIGPLIIFPFRDHHRDPLTMTAHGFLELTGNSCLAMVPLLALAHAWTLPVVVDAAVAVLALAVLMTNLVHGWAHAARVPALVARLQRARIVLPAAHHARHHAPGHEGAYCVTSGWANRWLDGLGVFSGLERALVALGVPATRRP